MSFSSSDDLQRQMRQIRQNLGMHSDAMVKQARAKLDWRNYVSAHPWIALSAAAAAGYFLAPRRRHCASVDTAAIHRTVDQAIRHSQQSSPPPPATVGFAEGLLSSLTALVLREGMALASDMMRHVIMPHLQPKNRPAAEGQNTAATQRE